MQLKIPGVENLCNEFQRGRRNFDIRRNRGFSPPERDISDHERAVEGIVENFIWDVLEEDLIPDLLIETLKDSDIANMVPVTQRRKEERASSGAELHVTEPKTRMDARNELMHFRAWVYFKPKSHSLR